MGGKYKETREIGDLRRGGRRGRRGAELDLRGIEGRKGESPTDGGLRLRLIKYSEREREREKQK
jgi:hypothetical protein